MADEVKQKIVLEGEKEYSAALKEANRNLKTLRSALKAETAELGANATAQQKNETKTRSLKKQIEQQEKIVQTLKTALKEVKNKYGDNSDEIAKWEQKLNSARYTLADMNNKLQTAEESLKAEQDALKDSTSAYDDAANAASDYANAVDSAGATADSVTFSGVMTAADNLTSKLKSAISFIVQVGKSAWEWMSDSGEWADTLQTESTKWGVDTETLQSWRYASRFVDTEVETIAKAFTKLTNRSESTNNKLKEIGIIADSGVTGQDLFWQVVESLSAIDDEATRDSAAMDIFGKSYQELLPLITAGRDAWEGYVEEAKESGYVLSDEQVDSLSKLDDANQELNASWEAMQHTMAAELAPAFTELATGLSSLISSFTEWSKTEQGQKTLADLGEAIKGIADQLVGDQNFKSIVDGAAGAIRGLTSALSWIKNNWQMVETGLKGIGVAFAGISVGKDVLSALMMIKGVKWFSGGGGAAAGASGAATAATGATVGGLATGAAGLAGVGAILAGFIAAANERRTNDKIRGSTGALEASANGNNGLGQAFMNYVNANRALDELMSGTDYSDEKAATLVDAAEAAREALTDIEGHEELLKAYSDWLQENSYGANSWKLPDEADIPAGWFGDVLDAVNWEEGANGGLSDEAMSGFQSLPGEMETSVYNGVVNGLSGFSINLDGYSVGTLIAPYVSAQIANGM